MVLVVNKRLALHFLLVILTANISQCSYSMLPRLRMLHQYMKIQKVNLAPSTNESLLFHLKPSADRGKTFA